MIEIKQKIKKCCKWFIYNICVCWRSFICKKSYQYDYDLNYNYGTSENKSDTDGNTGTTTYQLTDEQLLDIL